MSNNDQQGLESARLDIEKRRLELEENRAKREATFLYRNGGTLISAIVAVLALAFSTFQAMQAQQAKQVELATNEMDKQQELSTQKLEWQRNVLELFLLHDKDMFAAGTDQQAKVRYIHYIFALLPSDLANQILPQFSAAVVNSAEDLSTVISAVKSTTLSGSDQIKLQTAIEQSVQPTISGDTASKPTVYIQYQNAADASAIDSLIEALRQAGYVVHGKQLVTQATKGDIRYYKSIEKGAAQELAMVVNRVLAGRLEIKPASLMDLSRTFPNLPAGVLELWLPPLPAAS